MPESNENEKGFKWWIRYVIVPLIGGGGVVAIIVALLSQTSSTSSISTQTPNSFVQTLNFNYADSPIKHGWSFLEGDDPSKVVFNPIYENQSIVGTEITSPIKWGMEIAVEPATKQFGRVLEFSIVPRQDAAVYAYININNSIGDTSTGWLKFMYCNEVVQPITREGKGNDEWRVCLAPVSHKGDWLLFQANLIEEAKKTFSQDGWSFSGINKIRVRGNLSLEHISIMEE